MAIIRPKLLSRLYLLSAWVQAFYTISVIEKLSILESEKRTRPMGNYSCSRILNSWNCALKRNVDIFGYELVHRFANSV